MHFGLKAYLAFFFRMDFNHRSGQKIHSDSIGISSLEKSIGQSPEIRLSRMIWYDETIHNNNLEKKHTDLLPKPAQGLERG
jgi:hypothetical protein